MKANIIRAWKNRQQVLIAARNKIFKWLLLKSNRFLGKQNNVNARLFQVRFYYAFLHTYIHN